MTQAYGGNAAIDSDGNATGNSNLIPVYRAGSAQFPSADVDAGVFLNNPHPNDYAQYGPLVRIFKPGQNQVADELKVAKWSGGNERASDAFETNAANDFPQLKGVEPGGYDFIDRDPDRFNVYVKQMNVAGDFITVTLSTDNPDPKKAAYKDNPTTLRLVRMTVPGWQDWFWSDSLILVSNAVDDSFTRTPVQVPGGSFGGGIGADNAPPDPQQKNQKGGHDFPLGDRTFRVALGSKVKVEYKPFQNESDPPPVEVEVKIRKRLNVRAYILKDPNLTQAEWNNDGVQGQVISKAAVEDHVARMKELFAQVGIKVEETITVDSVPAAAGGLPAVDLTNGLMTTDRDGGGNAILDPETKALFKNMSNGVGNANGRTPTVGQVNGQGGVDDVEVYYVNRITRIGLRAGQTLLGKTFTRVGVRDVLTGADVTEHADTVIMSPDPGRATLAHEVFHALENRVIPKPDTDHYPYTGKPAKDDERVNLMVAGVAFIDELMRGGPPADPVFWSVRLTQEQEEEAYTGANRGNPNTKLLS